MNVARISLYRYFVTFRALYVGYSDSGRDAGDVPVYDVNDYGKDTNAYIACDSAVYDMVLIWRWMDGKDITLAPEKKSMHIY